MATRILQSKWVVLIGVLAVVGMAAAPAFAEHHHHYYRGDYDRHFVPYYNYGYSAPYYSTPYPYPYYYPQAAPYAPYYYGNYGGYGQHYHSGWGVHVYRR